MGRGNHHGSDSMHAGGGTVHGSWGAAGDELGAAGEAQATPLVAAGSATGTVGLRAFALAVIVQFVCIDDREGVLPAWAWDAWRVVQMW